MPPTLQIPTPRARGLSYAPRPPVNLPRGPLPRPAAAPAQRAPSDMLRDQYAAANSRPTPKMAPTTMVDQGRADQFREREIALADQLAGVASGQQRGAGELAVGRQVQNALGQAYGSATMARGNNAAGGARAAARAAGSIGLGGAGMAQEAALSDQSAARSQLAGVLGQGRGADLGVAGQNAAAQNAQNSQQVGYDLQARGMNDQAIANYLAQLEASRQYNQARNDARNPSWQQMLGGAIGQAGQFLGAL